MFYVEDNLCLECKRMKRQIILNTNNYPSCVSCALLTNSHLTTNDLIGSFSIRIDAHVSISGVYHPWYSKWFKFYFISEYIYKDHQLILNWIDLYFPFYLTFAIVFWQQMTNYRARKSRFNSRIQNLHNLIF